MYAYCYCYYYFARRSGDKVLWWARLCVFVCLSMSISLEPHAWSLPVFLCMLLMAVARSSSGTVTKSQGEGQFWGLSGSFKSIGNLCCSRCCRVCCKMDHSIASNVIQQKGHSVCQASKEDKQGIRKILIACDAAYWSGRGWWECTAQAKSDIYDCLLLL